MSTNISFLRDDEDAIGESNVGEVLKTKADEGVQVIVAVWDERTSNALNEGEVLLCTTSFMKNIKKDVEVLLWTVWQTNPLTELRTKN